MKRALQPIPSHPQQPQSDPHVSGQQHDSPYMTAEELVAYLRFPSLRALYRWLESHPLPRCRRGKRVLLFERRVVDAFIRGEAGTRRLRVVHRGDSLPNSTEGR